MVSILDVKPNEFIEKLAQELKSFEEIKPPNWSSFAKTGHFRQRPPVRTDWWYVRSAAVLRSVYKLGPIGVQKLRTKYGGKKDRGHKSEHFYKGSGNIIRKILQQLEKAGLIKHVKKDVHKGRIATPKARSFLAKVARQVPSAEKAVKGFEEKKKEAKEKTRPEKKEKTPEKGKGTEKAGELLEEFKEKGTLRQASKDKKPKKEKKIEDVNVSKEKIEELAKELRQKGTLRK